jgi:hypothetical protein
VAACKDLDSVWVWFYKMSRRRRCSKARIRRNERTGLILGQSYNHSMKPKIILCLALVLSGIFTIQHAYGFVAEIQINHTNLKTDYSFLKIKTVRLNFTNNPVVVFTVIVVPKDKLQQSDNFEGWLEISDANGRVERGTSWFIFSLRWRCNR